MKLPMRPPIAFQTRGLWIVVPGAQSCVCRGGPLCPPWRCRRFTRPLNSDAVIHAPRASLLLGTGFHPGDSGPDGFGGICGTGFAGHGIRRTGTLTRRCSSREAALDVSSEVKPSGGTPGIMPSLHREPRRGYRRVVRCRVAASYTGLAARGGSSKLPFGDCHPFSRVHGINSLPLSFAREKGLAVPRAHGPRVRR